MSRSIFTLSRFKNTGFKAFFSLGNILLQKGQVQDALSSYRRAFKPILDRNFYRGWQDNYCAESEFVINEKYNFIYCPIGKIASSSLKRVVVQLSDLENKAEILSLPKGYIHRYVEQTLTLNYKYSYQEAMELLAGDRYFKFVIVRNPWERLASGYLNKFVCRRNLQKTIFAPPPYIKTVIDRVYENKGLKSDYQKSISFKEFVNYIYLTEDEKLDGHWRPQYLHLGKTKFDFIGKLENLNADFEYLKKKLNLNIDLSWTNKTKRNNDLAIAQNNNNEAHYCDLYPLELSNLKDYPRSQQMYDPELFELVGKRYQKDIEMFGYDRLIKS